MLSIEKRNIEIESFLKNVDTLNLINKIKEFRKLNFQHMSDVDISNAILKVLLDRDRFVYLPNICTYPVDTKYFRVRPLSDSLIPKYTLSDFWNPPKEKVTTYGRLNKIGESLLYTSPVNPFVPINEMKLKPNSFYTLIVYAATKEVKVNLIGGEYNYEKIGITDRNAILVNELYNDFLREEFSRDVGIGTEYLYKISETIAKHYFEGPSEVQDAWAYPSVQNKAMYNVCFRPDKGKKLLNLHGAIVAKNERSDIIDAVFVSHGFDDNGMALFYEIGSDVQKRILPEIKSQKGNP